MKHTDLDALDKRILYELDMNSRIPVSHLARLVRASKETVQFRIKRLVRSGFIKSFVTTVFTSHLNRYYYKLFYKFHKATPEIERQIMEFISAYRKTAWFGSFEGAYDLAFLIIAQSLYDLDEFLTEFRNRFGEYILEQEIHTMTEVHRFNLKFFYEGEQTMHIKYPKKIQEPDIDKMDYEIIRCLANDARISVAELARRVGLDASTVLYRIRNLRKKEIIGTHTLAVDFEKFGMLHFQIDFKLRNSEAVKKAIAYFSQQRNCTFATVTLGKYDLAIELVVRNNLELKEILDSFKHKHALDIIDHDTFLITKEYNVTWFPQGA